jgi:hypothetical protein
MLNIRKDTLDPRFLKTLATKEKLFSDLCFNIIHSIKKKKTRCIITISNAFFFRKGGTVQRSLVSMLLCPHVTIVLPWISKQHIYINYF